MSRTILFPLPDRDFDVTEVAVPWKLLTRAGHRVIFATESGATPAADPLLLTGVVFGQLGAIHAPTTRSSSPAGTRRGCGSTSRASRSGA